MSKPAEEPTEPTEPNEPAEPRVRPSRDARRLALINAAKLQFSAKGYHATTVDDITRAAGVAKGTFYLYFGEKRAIYYEVIRGFMLLVKEIGGFVGRDEAALPQSPGEFIDRAEAAAAQLFTIFVENQQLARLAYRESMGLDPTLEEMIRGFYRELAELEAENLRVAIKMGFMRHDVDPLLTAYVHIGTVERVMLALIDSPDDFGDPQIVVRELMRLSWEGVRASSAPTLDQLRKL